MRASPALCIHLAANVVATRTVVASVELGKPLSVSVLGDAATHPVGVGPGEGGVVANVSTESEGLDAVVGEELHLVVPVIDGALPVGGGALAGLLVDVQILADAKSL